MYRPLKLIALYYSLFGVCAYGGAKTTICIKNQSDFEQISEWVKEVVKRGETDIQIIFPKKQTFVAKEKQLILGWLNAPNTNIRIEGNECVLLPEGKEYHNGDECNHRFSFDNSWMFNDYDVPLWGRYCYAKGLVEIVDNNTCRTMLAQHFVDGIDINDTYILIPEWCQTDIYKVTKIQDEFIYFTIDGIKKSYNGGYLVNDDYNYGGKDIRYKLCNIGEQGLLNVLNGHVTLPRGVDFVREGVIHNYITIQSSTFKSVSISGLEIRGNSYADSKPAILICDTKCNSIDISDCKFIGLHGTCISIEKTANVTVEGCVFMDCHYYGVCSDNGSKNTTITNNSFESMGKRMQCSFCITCKGEDYYVANNILKDFGYGGIGVGIWHGYPMNNRSNGIVENNELFYTEEYISDILDNCIMDGGAIYLWTKNDGAIIKNNYIHNISGAKDNRGIFCDDGARNFVIENNVIMNIHNSYCIDSRRVARMEPKVGQTNVNNVIRNNIVDGKIRFIGRDGAENGCEYGTNYFLVKSIGEMPLRTVTNTNIVGDDVALIYTGTKKGKLGLDSKSYKQLKKSPVWTQMKKRFVRKNK